MRLRAEEIAARAGVALAGVRDIVVDRVDPLPEAGAGSFTWAKSLAPDRRPALDRLVGALVVVPTPADAAEEELARRLERANAVLAVAQPRLVFAQLLAAFFGDQEARIPAGIDPSARVDPSARLAAGVTIGAFCFVGADVQIGEGTVLHPGVVVHSGSTIGARCRLKSHAVIGNPGFGFVRRPDGELEYFPQVGRVVVEDDVEIGAGTAVDRPALGLTVIKRGTKIDNLCHIAHGAKVGPHAVIVACAELGAGVVVGEGAWLGPNSCCLEGTTFGDKAFVGAGAVVVRDVASGTTVAGSPAETTDVIRRTRSAIRKLVESGT